jgi:hypothetical protein
LNQSFDARLLDLTGEIGSSALRMPMNDLRSTERCRPEMAHLRLRQFPEYCHLKGIKALQTHEEVLAYLKEVYTLVKAARWRAGVRSLGSNGT